MYGMERPAIYLLVSEPDRVNSRFSVCMRNHPDQRAFRSSNEDKKGKKREALSIGGCPQTAQIFLLRSLPQLGQRSVMRRWRMILREAVSTKHQPSFDRSDQQINIERFGKTEIEPEPHRSTE